MRRSQEDICADMIKVIILSRGGLRFRQLMEKANMTTAQLNLYIKLLLDKGYIFHFADGRKGKYDFTKEGFVWLLTYKSVQL